jgi:hypothetical protein
MKRPPFEYEEKEEVFDYMHPEKEPTNPGEEDDSEYERYEIHLEEWRSQKRIAEVQAK